MMVQNNKIVFSEKSAKYLFKFDPFSREGSFEIMCQIMIKQKFLFCFILLDKKFVISFFYSIFILFSKLNKNIRAENVVKSNEMRKIKFFFFILDKKEKSLKKRFVLGTRKRTMEKEKSTNAE